MKKRKQNNDDKIALEESGMRFLVILGGGESGVGTAILGKKKGYGVFVSDNGKIKD